MLGISWSSILVLVALAGTAIIWNMARTGNLNWPINPNRRHKRS